jgi:hypothetical protein
VASIKIPTYEEYYSYNGAHCHQLWAELSDVWRCPSCCRTKFEIMRWTTRYIKAPDGSRTPYKGWMAGLHKHHDHSQGLSCYNQGRFKTVIVCDQCNSSDGVAKRRLVLPRSFSFSPSEIGEFIVVAPHTKHTINLDVAQKVYDNTCSDTR